MTAELWISVIAGVVALASAAITLYGNIWQTEHQQRTRRREALDALLSKYREPLVSAAYDLQSRLYNIVRGHLLDIYHREGSESERFYTETSTLWILGQFLGWTEILRREVQFLDMGSAERNQTLRRRLEEVASALASDDPSIPPSFRLFRADQRAIGEIMLVNRASEAEARRTDCMGYAAFCDRIESPQVERWFKSWRADIRAFPELDEPGRLVLLQRALVDLIDYLDEDGSRFPPETRGKLPLTT